MSFGKKQEAVGIGLHIALLREMVPRRGLEPPRLAAQVPETCASTNSAIWATESHVRARPLAVNRVFEVFLTASKKVVDASVC
jgi:hypothetical protein